MIFDAGDTFDERYLVLGPCNEGGGMGTLLFVRRLSRVNGPRRVLKFCKATTAEAIRRFKREVRLMGEFRGNKRVVQLLYSNLDHDPPYFVMDYFEDGDLTTLGPNLRNR